MAETINSAFDVLSGLTVDEALANPHFMPELVLEELNGAEMQRMLFRDVTVNSNVIAYREALPSYLEDDVERVAEFGEIPVSDPTAGELKTTAVEKLGIAIRVSWEQRNDNDMDAVRRELEARKNTVLRSQARAALAAAPGVKLVDDMGAEDAHDRFPMPMDTSDQDLIWVGRVRRDISNPEAARGITFWCCGDQIRKGAATNAVQIAKLLCE